MVPRNDTQLAPMTPERVAILKANLEDGLGDLARVRRRLDRIATSVPAGPGGFKATVIRMACTLCEGWCCRAGGNDGFLDERTFARFRLADPDITDQAIMELYLDRVPAEAYEGSCIFHGKAGCTLERSMRSDVCNKYYCGGVEAYLKGNDRPEPTVVVAGEGDEMRTSPVLKP